MKLLWIKLWVKVFQRLENLSEEFQDLMFNSDIDEVVRLNIRGMWVSCKVM